MFGCFALQVGLMLIDLDLKSNDEKYLKVSEYIYYFLVGVITFYVNGS